MNIPIWFKPWARRISGMIAKSVLVSTNDDTAIQTAKVTLNGETHSKAERPQPYGITSRPPAGSQAVTVFIGSNRDNPVIIVCDDGRVRVKLEDGEVAVYNNADCVIKLTAGGKIELGDGTLMNPLAGLVTGECIDSFTGAPYADKSSKVFARKT